jgi:hypothetical protein
MLAAKNKVRLIIKLLLVLFLLPVVMTTQSPVGLKDTGASPPTFLFIPAFACSPVSVFTLDRRTHFNSFDELHTDALIFRQFRFNFAKQSSSDIAGYAFRFAPRADFADIPIRASPCHHKRNFVINS